jgi:hypothetical protein
MRLTGYAYLVVVTLLATCAAAQSIPTPVGDGQPIKSFKESLQEQGIGLTHASLVSALHNNDPRVRSQAAAVLAENHDQEAVILIEGALASEQDQKTMVELASVLMGFRRSNWDEALDGNMRQLFAADPDNCLRNLSASSEGIGALSV